MGDKDKLEVITWTRLAKATQEDNTMVRLMEAIHRGFPDSKHDVPQYLQEYHRYRHCLHTINDVNCYKGRLVIPSKLRTAALEVVHSAHQGCFGMNNRVEQSIFWPQISVDVLRRRHECMTCIRDAPSQPAGTPVAPPSPSYPFQMVVADYFSLAGKNYLVVGDRYSGWLSIHEAGAGEFNGATMVKVLREQFSNFSIPEELATDGGPQMMSTEVQGCLTRWGVRHRLSSAYFPHSNSRAELTVKAGKRLLRDNVSSNGSLATDKVMRALMQYRNTPLTDLRLSPAQVVFNRQLRDFLPVLPHKYKPSQEWSLLQEDRERALASRRSSDGSRLAQHTKQQKELPYGTQVAVQNQTGRNPNKWDKTGTVIETRPHSQVVVRLDGSRRMTLRNMQFIKEILPMTTTTAPHDRATVTKTPRDNRETDDPTGLLEDTDARGLVDEAAYPTENTHAELDQVNDVIGIPRAPEESREYDEQLRSAQEMADSMPRCYVAMPSTLPQRPTTPPQEPPPSVQPSTGHSRPRRTMKPSQKYSSEDYD